MTTRSTRTDVRALSDNDLSAWMTSQGEPKFRSQQLHDWLWKKGVSSFNDMLNLPQALRDKLAESFTFDAARVDLLQESKDGTVKLRFVLGDGEHIEGVLIPTRERLTACVSSQVGCALGCTFCATGFMGPRRNLSLGEIFDQVVIINNEALKRHDRKLTNIVFMGMGEPLLNYRNVLGAIDRITSPQGLGFSPRRVTVSTVGLAKMIRKLGDDQVRFNLALSLHSAIDAKRSTFMPINEKHPIDDLVEALNYFYAKTKNKITFEYVLLSGTNDTEEDALALAQLWKRVPVKVVNLIEYNPVEGSVFSKSPEKTAEKFMRLLTARGVDVTLRRSRGRDIDAACGQLANK
jgi:23S rRNA (adenine2503-C2)-methyltransferase